MYPPRTSLPIPGESTHDSHASSGSATSSVFYERRRDLGDGSSGPASEPRAQEGGEEEEHGGRKQRVLTHNGAAERRDLKNM